MNIKKTSNNLKWYTSLNREFSNSEIDISEKRLEKRSTTLAIREIPNKTSFRFHVVPVGMAKINKTYGILMRTWRKKSSHPLLMGMETCEDSIKTSALVPQESGYRSTSRVVPQESGYSSTTLVHIPKGLYILLQRFVLIQVHRYYVHNKNWKLPGLLSIASWVMKMEYIYTVECYSALKKNKL